MVKEPPLCHWYTSFGVWPRDHYMSLQRSTPVSLSSIPKVFSQRVPSSSARVSSQRIPLAPSRSQVAPHTLPYTTEQDNVPEYN
jgi:hypothetical protein